MAKVITTNATITCSHQGTVTLSSKSTLKVDGKPVLVKDDVLAAVVTKCTNTGPNLTPCTKLDTLDDGGEASKLRMAGDPAKPVLLKTATGKTNSSPKGTWSVQDPGQTKLDAS